MKVKQFEIWVANLNPQKGTEPGKTRPVVIIQTDLLNGIPHLSTIVCPCSTNVISGADTLRVFLSKDESLLPKDSDMLLDQIRAIDNRRLVQKVGKLPSEAIAKVKERLQIILDL